MFGEEYANEHFVYVDGKSIDAAANAAKNADIAIVFGSAPTGEGKDRQNLSLGGNIDSVIPAVAASQPNTIVVITTGGSVLTPWRKSVPVILTNFFPGNK